MIAALDSGEWFVVAAAGDREAATLTHASCPSCSEPSLQTDPEDALVKLGRC